MADLKLVTLLMLTGLHGGVHGNVHTLRDDDGKVQRDGVGFRTFINQESVFAAAEHGEISFKEAVELARDLPKKRGRKSVHKSSGLLGSVKRQHVGSASELPSVMPLCMPTVLPDGDGDPSGKVLALATATSSSDGSHHSRDGLAVCQDGDKCDDKDQHRSLALLESKKVMSAAAIKVMIQSYGNIRSSKTSSNSPIYIQVQSDIMNATNEYYRPQAIKKKIEKFLSKYREEKEAASLPGAPGSAWEWYEDVDKALGARAGADARMGGGGEGGSGGEAEYGKPSKKKDERLRVLAAIETLVRHNAELTRHAQKERSQILEAFERSEKTNAALLGSIMAMLQQVFGQMAGLMPGAVGVPVGLGVGVHAGVGLGVHHDVGVSQMGDGGEAMVDKGGHGVHAEHGAGHAVAEQLDHGVAHHAHAHAHHDAPASHGMHAPGPMDMEEDERRKMASQALLS
eukprot:jgi/Mesvir1/25133/Mv21589-RA.1